MKNAALETALSGSASQAGPRRSQYISIWRVMSPNQELMIMTPIPRSPAFAFYSIEALAQALTPSNTNGI
jgi:hypothetical protein